MLSLMTRKGITANVDNELDQNGIGRISIRKPENYLTLAVSPGHGDALKTSDISRVYMNEILLMSNKTMRRKKYSRLENVTHACKVAQDPSWVDRLTILTKSWLKYLGGDP